MPAHAEIWRRFFPQWRDPNVGHAVTAACQHPAFEAFYRDHLKKIVSLRGGQRYLSKGNYNFTRLAYLARLFPDARFLVPVRDPVEHVDSLVRQHRQFCEYAQADARVPEYLKIAGHFEFGPQRQPLRLDATATVRTREAWGGRERSPGVRHPVASGVSICPHANRNRPNPGAAGPFRSARRLLRTSA